MEVDLRLALISRLPMIRHLVILVDDTINIEGDCYLYYHKQIAQEEAKRIFPNKPVVNKIKVCTTSYPGS